MSKMDDLAPEILSVMKGMADLLEKQDTTQEKAKLDKPPKTGEDQKPIVGGTSPNGKPGEGFAKEFVAIPRTSPQGGSTEVDSSGSSLLKEDECAEEEGESPEEQNREEETGEETPEEESEYSEMKSLLKDIASSLSMLKKSQTSAQLSKADLQKAVRKEADAMLRKMGFTPSRSDVIRLGVDQTTDVRKGETDRHISTDIKKSDIDGLAGQDLSGLSWRELGTIREGLGGFNQFQK